MKKIILLIIYFYFSISLYVNAQSLSSLLNDKTKTYKDIQSELRKNENYLNKATEKERKFYERWRWFWDTRVDSTGTFEKYNLEMNKYFDSLYPDGIVEDKMLKSASTLNWTCLGPSEIVSTHEHEGRGRILRIWIHPMNHDFILIGANSGGLWKTMDGGLNWTCLTNNVMTGGVFGIAVNPVSSNTIFIATGLHLTPRHGVGTSGNYSLGILKTTNGGASWTKLNVSPQTGEFFTNIIMHPTNNSILYALASNKVYKTTNGGTSWTQTSLTTSSDQILFDIVFKPNNPETIYVSGKKNAIYRSTNGGVSWSNLSSNISSLYPDSRIAIASNPNNNNELYAFFSDHTHESFQNTPNTIAKSNDSGTTWNTIKTGLFTGVDYAQTIKLSPNGDIYLGGIYIYKSTDNGSTFSQMRNSTIHPDIKDFYFPDPINNNLVYVATDGGMYMDDAGGISWTEINGNLATNEFYGVDILPGNSNVMIGGTHDCGSYLRHNDGTWEFVGGGDGGTSLIDFGNTNYVYLSSNYEFLRRRSDWQNSNRIAYLDFFDSPVCMDPLNANTLIMQKWNSSSSPPAQLKKSTNSGSSWTVIDGAHSHARDITWCEANTDYIYYCMWDNWVGANAQIRRTKTGGDTPSEWEDVNYTDISHIRQVAPINSVHVHPLNPEKVWAIFGGFEAGEKIFYSEDAGDSWVNVTGTGLPNIPMQCFEYDFINQTMFVGTDVGVFYRDVNSSTWAYAGNLPKSVITEMKLNKLTGDLVVATYGRAIWSTNLGDGYCYDPVPLNINSNTTWGTNYEICKDVIVNTGSTLTVTANIVMSYKSTITVKSNATLTINAGSLKNGKYIIESGGTLNINNNGKIILNNSQLEAQTGALVNYAYGEIIVNQ